MQRAMSVTCASVFATADSLIVKQEEILVISTFSNVDAITQSRGGI